MKISKYFKYSLALLLTGGLLVYSAKDVLLEASSHREAPFIANDPLADNTDLYVFKDPDPTKSEMINIIANYIPFELPQGGPNYYSFGENIRYEIHIKNDATTVGDDVTYRFTFLKTNSDPTTFFNVRFGENLKTTYTCEKSIKGGTFIPIVTNGVVPPNNIGPKSITGGPNPGLGASSYEALRTSAIATASTGESIFCGPSDDPFFVDLGGIFDLGAVRPTSAVDGLAGYNTHSIAIQVPVSSLQKTGKTVAMAANILDGDYVIGVWASASRPTVRTLMADGTMTETGNYVQVSRLGMPLTNEAIINIAQKDSWNARTPYSPEESAKDTLFTNPELALYMDEDQFAGAVPEFDALRIQSSSLDAFDFRNGADGLFKLTAAQKQGTVFEHPVFGPYLLRDKQPRSVDILPIFHTGVPNLRPYQLATGKPKNQPLAAGKPFINNFLPVIGDMLRLNMAVPATSRTNGTLSSLGLIQAAVTGLTDPAYNNTNIEFIPNMDGFPNGRRLEDDVTRIELQAVSGVVLAAIGLYYDDYNTTTSTSGVTPMLGNVLGFTTGVEANDTTFRAEFPYVQTPWEGYSQGTGKKAKPGEPTGINDFNVMNISSSEIVVAQNFPNPFVSSTTIKYKVNNPSKVNISVYDVQGRLVKTLVNENKGADMYEITWTPNNLPVGTYVGTVASDGKVVKTFKMNLVK